MLLSPASERLPQGEFWGATSAARAHNPAWAGSGCVHIADTDDAAPWDIPTSGYTQTSGPREEQETTDEGKMNYDRLSVKL